MQLKYMGWPGTHQRMKGFSNPPVRTPGTPVQFDSIYGLPVRKVMTDNFSGGYRRIQGKRAMFHVSRPNYKRAVVTFERGAVVYKPSD